MEESHEGALSGSSPEVWSAGKWRFNPLRKMTREARSTLWKALKKASSPKTYHNFPINPQPDPPLEKKCKDHTTLQSPCPESMY